MRADNSLSRPFRAIGKVPELTARTTWTAERLRLLWFGLTGLGVALWIPYILAFPLALDAHAYFLGKYGELGGGDAYLYSPAFSQAIEPLRWLGWDGFRLVWQGLNLAALAVLAGPLTGLLLFVRPVAFEINLGNIHLLLAAAIVAGFRFPALWSFVLLTKVTPGVGLLWFAVRREWRSLGIALGATAAIAALSFIIDPQAWLGWAGVLAHPGEADGQYLLISAPLEWRLAAAALIVAWGARTDRRWTVLVGAFIALPAVWLAASAMLLGLGRTSARHLEDAARKVRGSIEVPAPVLVEEDLDVVALGHVDVAPRHNALPFAR